MSLASAAPELIDRDFTLHLISQLCYESSYFHNSASIIHITEPIATEPQYDLLSESIKAHMPIPKLNDPTWSQQDFSLLFRNHRVLNILGLSMSMESYGDPDHEIKILLNIGASNGEFCTIMGAAEENSNMELTLEFHLELLRNYYELQNVSPDSKFSTIVSTTSDIKGLFLEVN